MFKEQKLQSDKPGRTTQGSEVKMTTTITIKPKATTKVESSKMGTAGSTATTPEPKKWQPHNVRIGWYTFFSTCCTTDNVQAFMNSTLCAYHWLA